MKYLRDGRFYTDTFFNTLINKLLHLLSIQTAVETTAHTYVCGGSDTDRNGEYIYKCLVCEIEGNLERFHTDDCLITLQSLSSGWRGKRIYFGRKLEM